MMRDYFERFFYRPELFAFGRGGMLLMALGGAVFLAALIVLVILVVKLAKKNKRMANSAAQQAAADPAKAGFPNAVQMNQASINALLMLNERYVKGEISQEEYLTKKNDLLH